MELTHDSATLRVVARRVAPAMVRRWLRLALADFRRVPADALFYGAMFILMGYALTWYLSSAPQMVLLLSTLFLLGGPFLAIGLMDLARQGGDPARRQASLLASLQAWRRNVQGLTLYAVLLTLLAFGWFRVSQLVFALFYDDGALPRLGDLVAQAWQPQNAGFLLAYLGLALLAGMLVFCLSALAVPMMLDREIDTVSAMLASLQAVRKNRMTMAIWAAIIVLLTVLGLACYFVGLLFTMPLLAFASWHAYRDIITYEH